MATNSSKNLKARAAFVVCAADARAEAVASNRAYSADDVEAYIKAKASGKQASRPVAVEWRK